MSIRNGSEFIEIDTGKRYLYDEENAQWLEQSGSGGSGGGGDDSETTITIYDGDVELQSNGEGYIGSVTPSIEPEAGKQITIAINRQSYDLVDVSSIAGMTAWADSTVIDQIHIVITLSDSLIMSIAESVMPSQDPTQTLPIVITQEQSGGDESSDISVAEVT